MLSDPAAWVALLTLSALEIVLGIDNIIFISILVSRLPKDRQDTARITGLALAMLTRVALLFSIVWLTRLVKPWFYVAGFGVSGRDLILFFGGLFLLAHVLPHQVGQGGERHRRRLARLGGVHQRRDVLFPGHHGRRHPRPAVEGAVGDAVAEGDDRLLHAPPLDVVHQVVEERPVLRGGAVPHVRVGRQAGEERDGHELGQGHGGAPGIGG